jgi:hypothetical protein
VILSSGRTGTRFLARYLDANFSGVTAVHEPAPSWRLRIASFARISGRLSREDLCARLRSARRRALDSAGEGLYVESNPFLSGFVEVLDEVFHEPLVVHVVRDPRDSVRSALNHGVGRGAKALASRVVPYWYPNVRALLKLDHAPDWIERAAGLWMILNRTIAEGGMHCRHYHRLRYEDLFDARNSGLHALCGWLGLEFPGPGAAMTPTERVNPGRLDVMPAWPAWSASQCAAVERICRPGMDQFGYGNEPEWRQRVASDG